MAPRLAQRNAMSVEEAWGLTQAEETGYGPQDRMISFETTRSE